MKKVLCLHCRKEREESSEVLIDSSICPYCGTSALTQKQSVSLESVDCCANCGASYLISLEKLPIIGCLENECETCIAYKCPLHSQADDMTGGGLFKR